MYPFPKKNNVGLNTYIYYTFKEISARTYIAVTLLKHFLKTRNLKILFLDFILKLAYIFCHVRLTSTLGAQFVDF